jgi:adenylosuccinate synthase
MPITVLLGAQWGDEGKGRIVDALAQDADIVARYNGGDNAGHSITIGSQVVKLHLVPSGIFRKSCLNLLGNGVVINPLNLLKEMDEIRAAGVEVTPERLRISQAAHVILPGHQALDAAREAGGGFIGTTQRGIGFAYMDKASRTGLRANLMAEPERFADAVQAHCERVNKTLTRDYNRPALEAHALAAAYAKAAQQLGPYLDNTYHIVQQALRDGKRILAEGAQASLLDLDHGTYPFVTSSNATIGGVLTGLAAPAQAIERVYGVAKAFQTRVGGGPFVTELSGDQALRLRGTGANPWDEYGSTTGRPRRVGWLDLVALRYTAQLNGMTDLAVTKLDILSGLSELPLCVGYDVDGRRLDDFPQDTEELARCRPVYEMLPGWSEDISAVRRYADLPERTRAYLARIAEYTGVHVSLASVGPEREQLIAAN